VWNAERIGVEPFAVPGNNQNPLPRKANRVPARRQHGQNSGVTDHRPCFRGSERPEICWRTQKREELRASFLADSSGIAPVTLVQIAPPPGANCPTPWCKLPHPLVQIAPPPSKPSHRVAGLPGGRTEFMHCGRRRTRVRFVEVLVVLQPVRAAVGGTISAGNLQINNGGTLRLQGGQSAEGGHPVGHRSDVPQARPASDGGASENQPRVRTQKRTSMSISGTSMSTPTTVASAAPDARP